MNDTLYVLPAEESAAIYAALPVLYRLSAEDSPPDAIEQAYTRLATHQPLLHQDIELASRAVSAAVEYLSGKLPLDLPPELAEELKLRLPVYDRLETMIHYV